jgi:hypothetical protein
MFSFPTNRMFYAVLLGWFGRYFINIYKCLVTGVHEIHNVSIRGVLVAPTLTSMSFNMGLCFPKFVGCFVYTARKLCKVNCILYGNNTITDLLRVF